MGRLGSLLLSLVALACYTAADSQRMRYVLVDVKTLQAEETVEHSLTLMHCASKAAMQNASLLCHSHKLKCLINTQNTSAINRTTEDSMGGWRCFEKGRHDQEEGSVKENSRECGLVAVLRV